MLSNTCRFTRGRPFFSTRLDAILFFFFFFSIDMADLLSHRLAKLEVLGIYNCEPNSISKYFSKRSPSLTGVKKLALTCTADQVYDS